MTTDLLLICWETGGFTACTHISLENQNWSQQLTLTRYLRNPHSSAYKKCRPAACLLGWWKPNTWIGRVDSHKRKMIWKYSHQWENGLRKPLHWEAVLPQENKQKLHAQDLSTGTSYTQSKVDTLQASCASQIGCPLKVRSVVPHDTCCVINPSFSASL